MNGHTVRVFLYELRRNWRRRGYLFMTFGIPIIAAVLLFGYQFIQQASASTGEDTPSEPRPSNDSDNFGSDITSAGYVDLTGRFGDPGRLSEILHPYADEDAARAALAAGEIQVYYLIPADYMETGEVTTVQPKLNISLISDGPIQALILNQLSEGVDQTLYYRLVDPSNIEQINRSLTIGQVDETTGAVTQNEDASFVVVYIFAFALMLSLFITNGYLLQTVIEEKETRLIEILISTVRPTHLLMGKICALALLGLLQVVVWIGSFFLIVRVAGGQQLNQTLGIIASLANLNIPMDDVPLMLVYFVIGYFLFAGLYGIVGALSNSMREGPQYAVIFTLPAALPFYFLTLFVSSPDGTVPVIMSMFPLTAPMAMGMRLVVSDVPVWQIALSLVLLALAAVGSMWLAGRMFRVNTLLAGKLPKLRDIPALLRG